MRVTRGDGRAGIGWFWRERGGKWREIWVAKRRGPGGVRGWVPLCRRAAWLVGIRSHKEQEERDDKTWTRQRAAGDDRRRCTQPRLNSLKERIQYGVQWQRHVAYTTTRLTPSDSSLLDLPAFAFIGPTEEEVDRPRHVNPSPARPCARGGQAAQRRRRRIGRGRDAGRRLVVLVAGGALSGEPLAFVEGRRRPSGGWAGSGSPHHGLPEHAGCCHKVDPGKEQRAKSIQNHKPIKSIISKKFLTLLPFHPWYTRRGGASASMIRRLESDSGAFPCILPSISTPAKTVPKNPPQAHQSSLIELAKPQIFSVPKPKPRSRENLKYSEI
uniref:Uncharacterized protein n=1 Tax=Oryza rufipogon TaxID=4529 RepID=A0A0E0QLT2_ORYRU